MSSSSAGSLLLGIGGAFVGGFVGMPALGFAIGSSIGSALFPGQLPTVEGPRLEDTKVMSSAYGQAIPKIYGTNRVNGNLIWSSGINEHRHETSVGGKGGPSQTQVSYTYTASFAVAFCEGPVRGIARVWADGKLLTNNRADLVEDQQGADTDGFHRLVVDTVVSVFKAIGGSYYTLYLGDTNQEPDPTIESYEGTNNAPAYRGLCYVVFNELPLAKFGNRIPSITAEVMSVGTSTHDQIKSIRDQAGVNSWKYHGNTADGDGYPLVHFRYEDRIEVLVLDGTRSATGDFYMVVHDTAGKYQSHYNARTYGQYPDSIIKYRYTEGGQNWDLCEKMYFPEKDIYLSLRQNRASKAWERGLIPSSYPLSPSNSDYNTYAYVRLGNYVAGYTGFSARNILEDFTSLEAGNYFHGMAVDPTKIYCMLFFGNSQAGHPPSSYGNSERWYLCQIKNEFYLEILDSGTISHTGNSTGLDSFMVGTHEYFYMGSLDRDLRTFWFRYHAGSNVTVVYRIDPLTNVMECVDTSSSEYFIGDFENVIMALDSGVCVCIAESDILNLTLADTGDHTATNLGAIVKDVCTSVGISLSDIDTTDIDAVSVDGVTRDRTMTARAVLELLQRAFFFDASETDFQLKFMLRSAMSTTSLDADDLAENVKTIRSEDTNLPLKVVVKYHNMNANHQINAQQAKRIE